MKLVAGYEPQANKKFFGAAVFQKCCRGVGEQPTFAEQITEPNNETKQKSKRESEESQLPSKSKGCNERQGFRGNCDSQASWGCAPALLNRIREVSLRVIHAVFHMKHDTNKKASPCRLQATSRRQLKVFRCSSFSKMLPRCGRAAHICEANLFLRIVVPAAIAFMKTVPFAI